MATILILETATEVCSAALSRDGKLLGLKEQKEGYNHSGLLTVFAEELLKETGTLPSQLDAVCVSRGPGSYTGLRIGVSTAKGLCYALGIPLLAISTLDALAHYLARNPQEFGLEITGQTVFCPMLDARRMEVYTALYDRQGIRLNEISAQIIDENSFSALLEKQPVLFFGNGAAKCQPALKSPHALFAGDIVASARFMCLLAEERYNQKAFENVAYFEPFYLKDFVATVPKNKILG